jgi:hypothetical protein
MIIIENRKKSIKRINEKYPNGVIIDVTSKGEYPWVMFSPFYPHGNIPVPFSGNFTAKSVEGIWQGLKVFKNQDIDIKKFSITDMKGIKRTIRKNGLPLGHRAGINGHELLDYVTARKKIYIPTYLWVLENITIDLINKLIEILKNQDIILLDYETNCDIENGKKPISHAGLIKYYLETKFQPLGPSIKNLNNNNERQTKQKRLKSKNNKKKIKIVDQTFLFKIM